MAQEPLGSACPLPKPVVASRTPCLCLEREGAAELILGDVVARPWGFVPEAGMPVAPCRDHSVVSGPQGSPALLCVPSLEADTWVQNEVEGIVLGWKPVSPQPT